MKRAVVVLFGVFLLNGACSAQEVSVEDWNPPTAGPITTWTAPLCEKGKLVVQPFAFYTRTRGSFNDDGHYDSLTKGDKKSQFQQQLFAQYGVTQRFEVDGQIAYQENFAKQSGSRAHDRGLGDSTLFGRYCLLESKGLRPHIAGVVQLKMPTGKFQHADPDKLGTDIKGTGSWDPGIGIILTEKLKPFLIHFDAVYNFPQQVTVDEIKTRYNNYLNYDVGVEYVLPKGFNIMAELNGVSQGNKWEDGARTPSTDVKSLSFAPGIGWSNDYIQTLIAYQRTLVGTNTDANDSIVATFVYTF